MTLSLNERYVLAHPAETVWPWLSDIGFVAECFPGAALDEVRPDGGHSGSLTMRLGPTKARFAGVVHVELDNANRTATLHAQGSDSRRSMASADATVRLDVVDAATSAVAVDVAIELSGPLGQFARAGGAEVTRTLLVDFARNVDQRLSPDVGPPDEPSGPATGPTATVIASSPRLRELSVGHLITRSFRSFVRRTVERIRAKVSKQGTRA